jgi:hypothetical protein
MQKQPSTLFVYLTVPPLAPPPRTPLWKWLVKKATGRPQASEVATRQAGLARRFNEWTLARDGWLRDYPLTNVAVFDLYGSLADPATGLLRYPTEEGDSHPSRVGNAKVARELVPFLNRAVRRGGLAR